MTRDAFPLTSATLHLEDFGVLLTGDFQCFSLINNSASMLLVVSAHYELFMTKDVFCLKTEMKRESLCKWCFL